MPQPVVPLLVFPCFATFLQLQSAMRKELVVSVDFDAPLTGRRNLEVTVMKSFIVLLASIAASLTTASTGSAGEWRSMELARTNYLSGGALSGSNAAWWRMAIPTQSTSTTQKPSGSWPTTSAPSTCRIERRLERRAE